MRAVILHGTLGYPEKNWYPWLKNTLLSRGDFTVEVPTFPTPENQTPEHWIQAFRDQIQNPESVDLIVGHSCGGTLLAYLLDEKICALKHAIYVSAVVSDIENEELSYLVNPFMKRDVNWDTVKSQAQKSTVMHGDDDIYVPVDQAKALGAHLDVTPVIIPGGGHLNADSGYTELPDILALIDAE